MPPPMPPPNVPQTARGGHDQPVRETPIGGSGHTLDQGTSTPDTSELEVAVAGGAIGSNITHPSQVEAATPANQPQLVGATVGPVQTKPIGVDKEIQTDPLYHAPKDVTSSDDPELAVKDEYRISAKRARSVTSWCITYHQIKMFMVNFSITFLQNPNNSSRMHYSVKCFVQDNMCNYLRLINFTMPLFVLQ